MLLTGKKPEKFGFKLCKREENYETLLHPDEKELYIRWINRQSISPVLLGAGSKSIRIVFIDCEAFEIKNASWINVKDIIYSIKKEKLKTAKEFKDFASKSKKLKHLKLVDWQLHPPM